MNRRNIMKTGIVGSIFGLLGFTQKAGAGIQDKNDIRAMILFTNEDVPVGGIYVNKKTNQVMFSAIPIEHDGCQVVTVNITKPITLV
jgi:hypothetical protein